MEPTKPTRLVLPLMKARVVERTNDSMKIHIGGSTTVTVKMDMEHVGVRVGDILTLYTEVLYAVPEATPIQ